LTHVVMNLAAWTTWASLAHLPEVILATEPQNTLARRTHLVPEVLRIFVGGDFLVAFVNREPQPRRIQSQHIHQQLPGKLNRTFFEIVAKRKITEHLEKRVMPGRLTDFVQIVVLAAGAYTLLRRRSAHVLTPLSAQKRVF